VVEGWPALIIYELSNGVVAFELLTSVNIRPLRRDFARLAVHDPYLALDAAMASQD
jgi:hypothetical protein